MVGAFGEGSGRRRGETLGSHWVVLGLLCWGVWGAAAGAQLRARPMAYPGVDAQGSVTTLPAALRTIAEQADVVFLGTVESVTRVGGETQDGGFGSAGAVEVRFRVEQAVRGASGTSYTMREWGGLWPAGERRYLVGERRLMLLHRPSALGLSSPVAGMEGAIPVRGEAARVSKGSMTTGTTQGVADLRWIAAKLARPVRYGAAAGVPAGAMPRVSAAAQSLEASLPREQARAEGESSPSLVHGVVGRPVGTGLSVGTGASGGDWAAGWGWAAGAGAGLGVRARSRRMPGRRCRFRIC